MAINDDLTFEVNENGERVMVRSIESISRAYLRFTNRTTRPVDVSWRDFNGSRRQYMCLEPGTSYDINTYLTHPWEFTDRATRESYMINNSPIFRAPANIGGMMYRTNWNITVGVRTLRQTALLSVALTVPDVANVPELGLPRSLEEELMKLIIELKNMPPATD
ncbi:Von Hippel-Lindau disease tumor suppressor [Operophtera brumata]|uniref:von Hippel-Lindau disease tumor suppressor n=1 Tax=Operophtera brumata TaxID=104452 RepID=A0A0L7KUA7_OPEBR|nr:Von Hippel-Lindau disease tumor suppressor [Operophtera brumata]